MVRVNRKIDLSLWIVNEIIQVIYRKIINKRETNCTEYIARYKAKLVNCKRGYEPIIRLHLYSSGSKNYFTPVFTLSVDIFYRYVQDDIMNKQKNELQTRQNIKRIK